MRTVTVATLKLFGGHIALDFTNTVNSRGPCFGPDLLLTYGDLLDWGVRLAVLQTDEATGLRKLSAGRGEAALARAKALREALYRIFSERPGVASPQVNPERACAPWTPDSQSVGHAAKSSLDLDLLQREVCSAQGMRLLEQDSDGYSWSWRGDDPDAITHRIAEAAAHLLTSSALGRVHVCPGENCGWLFLDNSRPGRRLWCSEETCGTRSRVRRWRSRQQQ